MATPIYNPLEPTEEIQPKPESITPQEKVRTGTTCADPSGRSKTTVPSEEKKPSPKKKRQTCGETGNVKRKKETNKKKQRLIPYK
ncbi:hypothetical protein JG559_06240 [Enterococcus faecalis]|uniref:Uncharacterized protein n=1 Tax=Enterococcus faecalis TaxID=1351 RepID=A0A974NZ77_ENTFL|nr:hypothetical protein JG559_06240 [Enterococcus faecalis]